MDMLDLITVKIPVLNINGPLMEPKFRTPECLITQLLKMEPMWFA